ncbi:MAG: CBS domain-containing protein [Spirochaetes bacterium]|nr:CBS domain-containing protein [Spirochaetota bacterium]
MKISVSDILKKKGSEVVTIAVGSPLLEAVRVMRAHKIGAILVTGGKGRIEGILTERDVLRAVDDHRGAMGDLKVDDLMTKNVIVALPDDDTGYLMGIMTKNRIRHIPVVTREGVAGFVSIGDLVKSKLEDMEFENRMLADYIRSG